MCSRSGEPSRTSPFATSGSARRTSSAVMEPVRIGIIGYGRIGAEHAGWLSSASNARAAAVVDATPARQDLARQRGLRIFPTIDALLADNSIDAILVASPTAMHFDHASRAL